MDKGAVLAVDGGGTNCRALLCDLEGNVLSYVKGGSSNYHNLGQEKAIASLADVLTKISHSLPVRVKCAVFALAALNSEEDRIILNMIVKEALKKSAIEADQILLDNDGMMTLKGLVDNRAGVLVVSGTGSIACGIDTYGNTTRVGGWGSRIGDEGSGYSIGRAALIHIMRAYDGRDSSSGITPAVLKFLSFNDEKELYSWICSTEYSVGQVASISPVVCSLVEDGDKAACQILNNAAEELSLLAITVINKLNLGLQPFDLAIIGGVLKKNVFIRKVFLKNITSKYEHVEIIPSYLPICACARRGLVAIGINEENILDKLSAQLV